MSDEDARKCNDCLIPHVPDDLEKIFRLDGYTSVVTGGSSGLGEAIAIGLGKFGSDVILLARNKEKLERVKKRLELMKVKCDTYSVDVASWDSIVKVRDEIMEKHKKVDVLVNSAGIINRKFVFDLTVEEFKKVLETNITGTFVCCKAFGEMMVKQNSGSIINMSSIQGHVVSPRQSAYASSKGAIIQLTKVLAVEWAQYGVRVNAISPGYHKTPIASQILSNEAWYKSVVSSVPLGRYAEAHEVIGAAIFLASKASSFMTGSVIITDGGLTAH